MEDPCGDNFQPLGSVTRFAVNCDFKSDWAIDPKVRPTNRRDRMVDFMFVYLKENYGKGLSNLSRKLKI
jgi:hypothetical protein